MLADINIVLQSYTISAGTKNEKMTKYDTILTLYQTYTRLLVKNARKSRGV